MCRERDRDTLFSVRSLVRPVPVVICRYSLFFLTYVSNTRIIILWFVSGRQSHNTASGASAVLYWDGYVGGEMVLELITI